MTTLEQSPGIDAEYRLLREEAGRLPRPELRLIEVSGAEGADFLQGQLTNDIEALAPGQGCYAALLDRKGKMRSDMAVLRRADDEILLIVPELAVAEVERHLQMYKIGRDAAVASRDDLAVLSVIGPRTPEALGGVPLGSEYSQRELRLAERDVLAVTSATGADLIASGEDLVAVAELLEADGAVAVSAEAAAIVRVEVGRPTFGAEMGNETMPQEAGINERAVNFEKGCYVGQETVARLHYKGKPNRHLRRLRSSEPLEAGAEVRLGERVLGTLGTAVLTPAGDWQALAILRREAEPGTEVEVGEAKAAATVEEISA
jgi:folate-binding protein YgfZ